MVDNFDIFTNVPTPSLDPLLFAKAAEAGAQVGNAIPNPVTAMIQGGLQGYQQGQQIQNNALKNEAQGLQNQTTQHAIDRQPVTDSLQDLQIQNAQTLANLNQMKAHTQELTYADNLRAAQATAQQNNSIAQGKLVITNNLNSQDPATIRQILSDPNAQTAMSADSKYADSIYGAISARLSALGAPPTEDERNQWLSRLDYVKSQDWKHDLDVEAARRKTKDATEFDKLETDTTDNPEVYSALNAAKIRPQDIPNNKIEVVPSGSYEVYKNPDTGEKTDKVDYTKPRKPGMMGGAPSFDVVVNDRISPVKINDKKAAANLMKYIDAANTRATPPTRAGAAQRQQPAAPTPAASQTQTAAPTPSIPDTPAIRKDLNEAGFDDGSIDTILNYDSTQVITGHDSDNADQRAAANEQFDAVITKRASAFLDRFNAADPDTKQSVRDWADKNNVTLTQGGLSDYFDNKVTEALDAERRFKASTDLAHKKNAMQKEQAVADRYLGKPSPDMNPQSAVTPSPYLTKLTPEEQSRYQQDVAKLSQVVGHDISGDVADYDLPAAWRAGEFAKVEADPRHHGTDKYKLPNHITFSDQSKYSNDKTPGGKWAEGSSGDWSYTPSAWQMSHPGYKEQLQKYWNMPNGEAAHGNKLILPSTKPQAEEEEEDVRATEETPTSSNIEPTDDNAANPASGQMFNPVIFNSLMAQGTAALKNKVQNVLGALPSSVSDAMVKVAQRIENSPYFSQSPYYVKAIAAVESKGNVNAVSNTGVQGIMQVTDAARRDAEKIVGHPLNLHNPKDNAEAGSAYIGMLMGQFPGSRQLAYAAYNAGASVVRKAQALAGGSNDWNVVKEKMLPALRWAVANKKLRGVTAEQKFNEVYNYPERVTQQESLFMGGSDVNVA